MSKNLLKLAQGIQLLFQGIIGQSFDAKQNCNSNRSNGKFVISPQSKPTALDYNLWEEKCKSFEYSIVEIELHISNYEFADDLLIWCKNKVEKSFIGLNR